MIVEGVVVLEGSRKQQLLRFPFLESRDLKSDKIPILAEFSNFFFFTNNHKESFVLLIIMSSKELAIVLDDFDDERYVQYGNRKKRREIPNFFI